MRILRVIASMDPIIGGPCQGIRNSITELKKLGVINEVVCLDEPTATYFKTDDFTIHALGNGKGPWHYHNKLIPWLLKNLFRFDSIIVHGLWLYPSFAVYKALIILKKRNKSHGNKNKFPRLYIMPHGMLDPYFQRATNRKLKAFRNWVYWKLIECYVVQEAEASLFTCEEELQLARQPFRPYKPKREINVGYGIIPPPAYSLKMKDEFSKICPKVTEHSYLLFLGRLHPKKGVDILIQAYSLLLRQSLERGNCLPPLVIAGPGIDTAFGKYIQQLVAQDPLLRTMVLFPGMLAGDAKWGAIYGCEAFILPSHQENFGIAVVEALACGKAVLISNQVNIWQEIKNEGGCFISQDTLEGTTQLLKNWFGLNLMQRLSMQTGAYNTYKKYFEASNAAQKFLQAINS